MSAMAFAILGKLPLQKWGILLCNIG